MQAQWRHRLLNGSYSIRAAGIFQHDPDAFIDDDGVPLSGDRDFRGGVHTDGAFDLSADWVFGWVARRHHRPDLQSRLPHSGR